MARRRAVRPKSDVSLAEVGVPMNSSSSQARCDLAPQAFRKALARYSFASGMLQRGRK